MSCKLTCNRSPLGSVRSVLTVLAVLTVLSAVACGSEPKPNPMLSLAPTYDAAVAVRVAPEGGVPSSFAPMYLTFDGLLLSGGRVTGTLAKKGGGTPVALFGSFSAASGDVAIEPLDAAFTSDVMERVDELGGTAVDILPRDGVADELSGYFRSRRGTEINDGTMLAAARSDRRPEPPEESRVTVTGLDDAHVQITGAAGTVVGAGGVEVFRFQLATRAPEFTLGQAEDDGSFSIEIPGKSADLFALRTRSIGMASDARFFTVKLR